MNSKSKSSTLHESDIRKLVQAASKVVPLLWPLKTFIANNPLRDLETLSFEEALKQTERFFDFKKRSLRCTTTQRVNFQMIKWCQAFCDQGQAKITIPHKQSGFYKCFLKLAPYDSTLCKHRCRKEIFSLLPSDPCKAVNLLLEKLSIPKNEAEEFISQQFSLLPGWGAFVKREQNWFSLKRTPEINLIEFIAVRLAILYSIDKSFSRKHFELKSKSLHALKIIEQKEKKYKETLLKQLHFENGKNDQIANAQFIFCIDVRSEPMRRSIENMGNYKTLGFAGFFAMPVSINKQFKPTPFSSCPVLIEPSFQINEYPLSSQCAKFKKSKKCHAIIAKLKEIYKTSKYNIVTPLALVEMLGLFCGFFMISQHLAPHWSAKVKRKLKQKISPTFDKKLKFSNQQSALKKKSDLAENALRGMSLIKNFSPLVVFCAHGSTTQNNPYASSLQCGACGGNEGKDNAIFLSELLNDINVRAELGKRGITIPEQTWFLAASHDTTTHKITLVKPSFLPNALKKKYEILREDIYKINDLTTKKVRLASAKKSLEWSQVRPEWGLAKNASMIIGRRSLSKNVDLKARSFLHTYDWQEDSSGKILEAILTAPLIVAQWINAQYFFSTLYPNVYGSGNKITHNVVGKLGVMEGNCSDLKLGLPMQSTHISDTEKYHEPLRLLVIIEAPFERVNAVIKKHANLQNLFCNNWIYGVVLDPLTKSQKEIAFDLKKVSTEANDFINAF